MGLGVIPTSRPDAGQYSSRTDTCRTAKMPEFCKTNPRYTQVGFNFVLVQLCVGEEHIALVEVAHVEQDLVEEELLHLGR